MASEASDKTIMLALTNCLPGREDEFNEWYDNTHVKDLLAVPGVVSAQRFKIPSGDEDSAPYQYLTVYGIEGSVEDVRASLAETRGGRVISETLAPGGAMWTFEPMGPQISI
jgi:hypothetical protein